MALENSENRYVIDMLRACAVLLVFFFHIVFILGGLMLPDARERFLDGFPSILSFVWHPTGVDVIFLISAFLLSYAMFREYEESGRISIRNHYLRRLSRILPLYYFAIFFHAAFSTPTMDKLIYSLLFIGIKVKGTTVLPVGWSTEALMHAYVVLPFILIFLVTRKSPLLWIAGFSLVMLAFRFFYILAVDEDLTTVYLRVLARSGDVSQGAINVYSDIWFRSIAIWMGIGLAWAVVNKPEILARVFLKPKTRAWVLLAIVLTWIAAHCVPIHDEAAWPYRLESRLFWVIFITFQSTVACTSVVLAISFFLFRPKKLRIPQWVALASHRLSRDIFGFYLFHYGFIVLAIIAVFMSVDREVLITLTAWQVTAITILSFAMSLGFAMLVGRFIERPAQAWLRRQLGAKSWSSFRT